MTIKASVVKELRDRTGVGMMECKAALQETDGDMERAVQLLREKGLAGASKKSGRIAAEGRVVAAVAADNKSGIIAEINCETDFAAKTDDFKKFCDEFVVTLLNASIETPEEAEGTDLEEAMKLQTAAIGERVRLRRFTRAKLNDGEIVAVYAHFNGKVGALLIADGDVANAETLRQVAMHAASQKPTVLSHKDLDPAFVASENKGIVAALETENEELTRLGKPLKRIPRFVSRSQLTDEVLAEVKAELEAQLKEQGKPEKIWDRIIPGQLDRFMVDNTQLDQEYALLEQFFVMDDKKSVKQVVDDAGLTIKAMTMYNLGEGLERRANDLGAEVAAEMAKHG